MNEEKHELSNENRGKTSKRAKRRLFVLWLGLFFFAAVVLGREIFYQRAAFRDAKEITIEPGIGSRKIAELLEREMVIRSKLAFEIYVSLLGKASELKPGKYVFGRLTIPEITRDLIRGVSEVVITVPEGWTNLEIAEYLDNQRVGDGRRFLELSGSENAGLFPGRFVFLGEKPEKSGLEGYLFPDTYRVFKDAASETIIAKMLLNFDKKISPDMKEEIRKQKKTLFEIVTMASLIEKEVVSEQDRAVVSGILWKRIDAGIPLQVDASVVYVKKQQTVSNNEVQVKPKINHGTASNTLITSDDLKIDSPYNTYKYRGLPVAPISNPGLSAIRAALYPKKSPYLYYLSAPDGKTIFSRTLEEHNAAKKKYLKN